VSNEPNLSNNVPDSEIGLDAKVYDTTIFMNILALKAPKEKYRIASPFNEAILLNSVSKR
jgi:hypothetical protein